MRAVTLDDLTQIEPTLAMLRETGCRVDDVELAKPDLEAAFVAVMRG